MTSQCEAYEVMKLQDKPTREQNVMATAPEQVYEEVGEGPAMGHGQKSGVTPTQVLSTAKQMYEEVGEGLVSGLKTVATPSEKKPSTCEKEGEQFSTQQKAEPSHYE